MSRRPVRLPSDGRPFLELLSLGRPSPSARFTPAQIEQIRRTVTRTPEVMVKVTGGGTKIGAVAALARAHIAASPPLTIDELTVLKHGVAVLAKLGRALSQTARFVAQGGPLPPEFQKELALTRTVVAALEQRTHDLARSALVTWESRYE